MPPFFDNQKHCPDWNGENRVLNFGPGADAVNFDVVDDGGRLDVLVLVDDGPVDEAAVGDFFFQFEFFSFIEGHHNATLKVNANFIRSEATPFEVLNVMLAKEKSL